ncbi:MAG TPA: hypothetical protein VK972_10805 [Wenzhouxiangella sp.]|nr:hypothetical protein [Wenzhouxiangella sp.]
MRLIVVALIAAALVACSSQDDSGTAQPADSSADVGKAASEEREGTEDVPTGQLSREDLRALARDPEAMRDPERRQAVRERLRALRQEGQGNDDRADRRAAMRERAERYRQSQSRKEDESAPEAGARDRRSPERSARWWENDVIARNISLSEQQRADIDSAHQQLVTTARTSRQQLAQAAAAVSDALKAGDRERLSELADARFEALQARARAEARWMKRLLEILSDEQMNKLVEERPELVNALLAPVR